MSAVAKIKQEETAVAPRSDANPMVSIVERIMADQSLPIERVEQAFAFYQKVQAGEARRAFDEAMAQAKAEIQPIVKNRNVSFEMKGGGTKSYRHEDLAGIAQAVDPILAKYGLSYRFRTTSILNEPVSVTCIVSHRLGYSEENTLHAGRDDSGNKNSIQAIGSTITYLQRYTLKAALGLAAAHDDDGKKADASHDDLEPLDDAQIIEMQTLITETKSDLTRFLQVANAESVSDILKKDFPRLKALLLKKKGRK